MRTSVSQTASLHPPSFAGTTFLKPQPATSPSKPEQAARREGKGEDGTLTAHPHQVITTLKSIVEPHSNVPRSISSRSAPTCSPSLAGNPRWPGHTLTEMIVFIAFIYASVALFNALAGIGYVPGETDQSVSGWRAPGPEGFRHGMPSKSSMFQGLLRRTALEEHVTGTDDDEAKVWYPDVEGCFHGLVHHSVHQRPHFDASQKAHGHVTSTGHVRVLSYINQLKGREGPAQTSPNEDETFIPGRDQET